MDKRNVKKAAALAYNPGENNAPKVIASGKGIIAEKIVEKAREQKIPVVEDAHLADTLVKVRLGSEIPEELYEVVAEVLSLSAVLMKPPPDKFARRAAEYRRNSEQRRFCSEYSANIQKKGNTDFTEGIYKWIVRKWENWGKACFGISC